MKTVFADTFYWIVLFNPQDDWHSKAKSVSKSLSQTRILTTDSVLVEFVNFFSDKGAHLRRAALEAARKIMNNPNIQVLPQSRDLFYEGINLFASRLDKGYSLTDCISMAAMKKKGLHEILTHDHHFEQEGFTILLTD